MQPPENFTDVLNDYRQMVWIKLKPFLDQISQYPEFCCLDKKYSGLLDYHSQLVSDYPRRQGKYLRPFLLLLTAQSMGVDIEAAMDTAIAMQLSEDWILNHDDIEDDSLYRRGQPALHRVYGKELATNAGDALHVLMWQVLNQNFKKLPLKQAQTIADEFFLMLSRTILGQTIELKWTREKQMNLSKEDIFLISESKTGYYTIAGPMRLGAIFGGATKSQLDSIYRFGLLLGRSFQIIDDLLDLTSDFNGQKNQKGNDIYEGKITLMLVHLLEHSDLATKNKAIEIIGKDRQSKTQAEVDWLINTMENVGSFDYSQKAANDFATQAVKIFETELSFLSKEPFRSHLRSTIDFIVTRKH